MAAGGDFAFHQAVVRRVVDRYRRLVEGAERRALRWEELPAGAHDPSARRSASVSVGSSPMWTTSSSNSSQPVNRSGSGACRGASARTWPKWKPWIST